VVVVELVDVVDVVEVLVDEVDVEVDVLELEELVELVDVDELEVEVLVELEDDEELLDVEVLVEVDELEELVDVDEVVEVDELVELDDDEELVDVEVVEELLDVEVELELGELVDVEVELLDVDELVGAAVLVVVVTHVPSSAGFLCLYSNAPLLPMLPSRGPNRTLYVSPPVISSSRHPSVPGSGGSTEMAANLPVPMTLMRKTPLADLLICADLMGPFSPRASRYLKPLTASPLQNARPVIALEPCGRENVWLEGVPPLAVTVRAAPVSVGSPTIRLPLPFSFALPTTFRLSGVLGFLSCRVSPRMVWSTARADSAAIALRTSVPMRIVRARCMATAPGLARRSDGTMPDRQLVRQAVF
jgi:myotubularin-related protein 9